MKQRWWVSLVVSVVMLLTMMPGITVLSANQTDEQVNTAASEKYKISDFNLGNANIKSADINGYYNENADVSAEYVYPTSDPNGYIYDILSAYFGNDGKLNVVLRYNGNEANPTGKLFVGTYDEADSEIMLDAKSYDIKGTTAEGLDYIKPGKGTVRLYIWDGVDSLNPLSGVLKPGDTPPPTFAPTSTPEPTAKPTAVPTATPTAAPTATPTMVPYDKKAAVIQNNTVVGEYGTIREAVAKAKEINPKSEAERVTINVNPGDYEEQVKFDGVNYVTLQQTPETTGKVTLHWYYCTGYCASNCDLAGNYNPDIDWSLDETWNGYKAGDEKFTKYEIGEVITGKTISYYDKNGVAHKNVKPNANNLGSTRTYDQMGVLIVNSNASNIIVKDLNVVNSVPVMVTQGEKDAHLTPQLDRIAGVATSYVLPYRDNLAICDENTPEDATTRVKNALAIKDENGNASKRIQALQNLTNLTAGESAYLAKSASYNERGHALALHGDKVILENVRARGNQDSVYITNGRMYFKNCDLIGGTDYIYGDATAVFDNCKLGAEGMSNATSGATITAANTSAENPYGYLFWNCEIYNMRSNTTSNSNYGRPWNDFPQVTYYNTTLDDSASTGKSRVTISADGWNDMTIKKDQARFFEYGTKNKSGKTIDLSKRVKNAADKAGMGTVLNDWQILEFNPRNYFTNSFRSDAWDPMNFSENLKNVDAAIAGATVVIPENEETTITLPTAPTGVSFKWESSSENATVSSDGTKLTVVRPAAGENSIESSVVLYARDNNNGYGDKKTIPVLITPTTNTKDVYTVSGNIELSQASESDVTVTIKFMSGAAQIKKVDVIVPAGAKTQAYTVENLPVGTYTAYMSIGDPLYNIATESQKVDGTIGSTVSLNIDAKKMQEIIVSSPDFDGKGYIPTINSASGFSGGIYTVTGKESANLGEAGNKVLKLTKNEGSKVAAKTGASFNLTSMLPSGSSLANTKTIKFSYDFLMESTDYFPNNQSGFDLATSTKNGGDGRAEDQTRFVRWGVYKGWSQFNMYTANNTRINGDNTQFNRGNNMANKWYRIVADIDLENQIITTTLYDRDWKTGDAGSYILNKKPFVVAAKDADGNNNEYPKNIDLSNLYFNIYMDVFNDTVNKMEYYFDNIELIYQDFE